MNIQCSKTYIKAHVPFLRLYHCSYEGNRKLRMWYGLDIQIQFQSLAIRSRPAASPRVISSTQRNDPYRSHVNYYISFLPGRFFSPRCELRHFPVHSIPAVCWPAAPVTEDELWNNCYFHVSYC